MEKQLFEKIDELSERYLDILEDVCNIESPTDFKKGVDAVAKYFADMARARGWKTEVVEQEVAGDALCITLNPDAKKQPLSVSGHIDTVHPVGLFGYPPVRRDEKNMYGPGVMDCKGGVVAAVLAMDALEQCGFTERPVQLLIQSDEENNSSSSNKATINYICKKAEGSVAFLNLEGHQSGTAVIRRKGILRYRFTVHGRATHSAKCTEGANAITEAAYKIIELEKMKDSEGLTCNCGVIEGGSAPNTVADTCRFYADIRFSSPEELAKAKKTAEEIANDTKVPGCSCALEEISLRPAMKYSEKNNELLDRMNEIYKENNMPVLAGRFAPGGSDAAYITECGIPCIDSLGVSGNHIHSTDEYTELKSLAESAKRIAAVALFI